MRIFTKMKQSLIGYSDLNKKTEYLVNRYDKQFKIIFDALKEYFNQNKKSIQLKKLGSVDKNQCWHTCVTYNFIHSSPFLYQSPHEIFLLVKT